MSLMHAYKDSSSHRVVEPRQITLYTPHVHNTGIEVYARSTQTGCASIFRGDAVIVTVPLGVLKAQAISFHPPLPEWKTQAINNLGFGLLNKVGWKEGYRVGTSARILPDAKGQLSNIPKLVLCE